MASSSNLPYDALETLRVDGAGFIDLIRNNDPDIAVPACPGWTLADLAYHQGEVWHFWGRIVASGITEREQLRAIRQIEQPSGPLLSTGWRLRTTNCSRHSLMPEPTRKYGHGRAQTETQHGSAAE